MTDAQIAGLVRPLGLTRARISYLRSLETFLAGRGADDPDPLESPARDFIAALAAGVAGASFKVAQCATLYARGYHSGIIPVDSGMVTKLAPVFGMMLEKGPQSHERMRLLLESCANADAPGYRELIDQHRYQVKLPDDTPPTWWLHLVLIYFKRRFLGRPVSPMFCRQRPVCAAPLNCVHAPAG